MATTTGGFSSEGLGLEARTLELESLSHKDAIEIGEIALDLGFERGLGIAVEVRLKELTVFHASLPGSTPENDSWIARKARVVLATGNSTMYERVLAEEQGIDWYAVKGLPEETHAIHGGGLPLNVKGMGCVGILLISGLPQVQDHLLGVEVLTEFLARNDVDFIDGISTDAFGLMARKELERDGVGLALSLSSDKPTCTATVTLDAHGSASYEFLIDGTATFDFAHSWLPDPERLKPSVLHIGTLVTIVEPASSILYDWAVKTAEFAPIVFDPNVRTSVVGDHKAYRAAVEKWVEISSVIKLSDDDISWLCDLLCRWITGTSTKRSSAPRSNCCRNYRFTCWRSASTIARIS